MAKQLQNLIFHHDVKGLKLHNHLCMGGRLLFLSAQSVLLSSFPRCHSFAQKKCQPLLTRKAQGRNLHTCDEVLRYICMHLPLPCFLQNIIDCPTTGSSSLFYGLTHELLSALVGWSSQNFNILFLIFL